MTPEEVETQETIPEEAEKAIKSQDKPRIGVFVCHCGVNIGGFVDVPDVAEYAKTLPFVVYAENNLFTCASDGLTAIKEAIKKHNLNRVIVASCTPRTHQPLFQATCEEAGLNKYLFNFVNIREQCSWVHMKEGELATEKAKELIRMGVARAALLQPQEEVKVDVEPTALVIGGGVSGMTAAKSLGNMGFDTHLIEKDAELGGFVRNLHTLYQTGKDANESIQGLIQEVKDNQKIHLNLSTTLKELKGYIGNYEATIADKDGKEQELKIGTIIIATGSEEYKPKGLYGYGEFPNVVTQVEFENLVKENKLPENLKSVAFIQCAGARGQDKLYCSRICCTISVKNAIKLMDIASGGEASAEPGAGAEGEAAPAAQAEAQAEEPSEGDSREGRRSRRRERRDRRRRGDRGAPEAAEGETGARAPPSRAGGLEVTIFNRGITTYGVHNELMYNDARGKRVKFNRFVPERIPEVVMEDNKLCINYFHETLQIDRKMYPDLIVLATPIVQHPEAEDLSKLLKVPLGQDKFFLEAHVKLRPIDFATDGIFLCGTAHAPADINESIAQAYASASHAAIPLARGFIIPEAITAEVDINICCGCKSCEKVCPYSAIAVTKTDKGKKAQVVLAACKGCGSCASICPENAITMRNFTDEQLISEGICALREVV
ncbi:MAG: CoB--CoM heterodisulfide reductase iron-sulfur subunit A family protein [Thermoplasmata archaeon]|nr:MAG: CoB--CoM heterodisulfide reductase iron-sulfur subunit A family protein [Thermoplasmata archaeon]